MRFNFKDASKSIATRWIIRVFSIVVAVIVIVAVVLCSLIKTYIENGLKNALPDYVGDFEKLSASSSADFENTAIAITEEFENRDKIKVMVINESGEVISSTDGVTAYESTADMKDYISAKQSSSGTASFMGKQAGGSEKILATTVMIKGSDGRFIGAYRYIISLTPFTRTVNIYCGTVILIGLILVFIVGLSGVYFISSIVSPVRMVTNTARRIARGDLDTRLEKKSDDEIGDLVDTINYMAVELGKTEQLKNEFVSGVSHELRTPLTAIRGWGETVKLSVGNDDETVKKGIDIMLTETDRLSKLVEELLDFSRMQQGRLSFEPQKCYLEPLVFDAVSMYEELAKKQGITITYMPLTDDVFILADKNRLEQVIINLLDNAVKYSYSGGQILVSYVLESECVQIIISDTGVGIPSGDLSHVKEKFYKANKTVRGSGIGLAVADEITKLHNGLLIIDSTEGVGTTATVVLPLYNETAGKE